MSGQNATSGAKAVNYRNFLPATHMILLEPENVSPWTHRIFTDVSDENKNPHLNVSVVANTE